MGGVGAACVDIDGVRVVKMLPVFAVDVVNSLGRLRIISRFCLLEAVLMLWSEICVVMAAPKGDGVSRFLIIVVLLLLIPVLMVVRGLKRSCFVLFDFVLLVDFVLAVVLVSKFFVIVSGVLALKFVVVVLSMLVVLMLMLVWKFGGLGMVRLDCVLLLLMFVWKFGGLGLVRLDCVLLYEMNFVVIVLGVSVLTFVIVVLWIVVL
jgi:hypothetical protein